MRIGGAVTSIVPVVSDVTYKAIDGAAEAVDTPPC
jgi:hypothetical protein